LEDQISSQELYQALLSLTPKQKKVLQLTYVKQLLDKDIANRLGVSQQAVSQTRRTALKKLKKSLGGVVP
jgi:RNA polymerase sigma factor (sigma-70 family)